MAWLHRSQDGGQLLRGEETKAEQLYAGYLLQRIGRSSESLQKWIHSSQCRYVLFLFWCAAQPFIQLWSAQKPVFHQRPLVSMKPLQDIFLRRSGGTRHCWREGIFFCLVFLFCFFRLKKKDSFPFNSYIHVPLCVSYFRNKYPYINKALKKNSFIPNDF